MYFVYYYWFLEDFVYWQLKDGAVAAKYVKGFIKTVALYMLCAIVGSIISNINYIKMHGINNLKI